MENNIKNYEQKGLIGLNYLIKYIKKRDKSYLSIVKENTFAIRFWTLITLLQNNHELIFSEIDSDTLNDLFNLVPIMRNNSKLLFDDGSYYDYGNGYKSNSNYDYLTQFKLIRNAIAHNEYEIADNMIKVSDKRYGFEAIFDYKWFETAILCTLSNRNYQFKAGLNETFLVCPNNDGSPSKEHIYKTLDEKTSGIIKVNLETNSLERACRSLNIVYKDNYKFYNLFIHIKNVIQQMVNKDLTNKDGIISNYEFFNAVNKAIKELNIKYAGSFSLEYIPFTRDFVKDIVDTEYFDNLSSFPEQMEILFNHYKRKYLPELENTLAFKYLLDLFIILDSNNEIDNAHELFLDDTYNLLVKSLGNLVFNSVVKDAENYRTLSSRIFKKYKDKMRIDFGHAKNYYKEYLKRLSNSLEDAKKNGFPFEKTKELSRIKERTLVLNQKIEAINKGENPEVFLGQLRNIFAHGYCDANFSSLHLYDKDISRRYYKYSKSKKTWEEKEFDNSPVIFNLDMSTDVFMDLIKEICDTFNLEVDYSKEKEMT